MSDSGERDNEDIFAGAPRVRIPEVLFSFYEERAFVSCTRCGESLADFKNGYKISKNFKKGEVIMEYALCMPCMESMMNEASVESKKAIQKFQDERYRHVSGFEECALCDKKKESVRGDEFGLTGICQGHDMIDSAMICVECMEDMSEVLSDETRGKWGRFREENFPGIPGDFKPMPAKPTPVVS